MQLKERIEAIDVLAELDLAQQRGTHGQFPIDQCAVGVTVTRHGRGHASEQRCGIDAHGACLLGCVLCRVDTRTKIRTTPLGQRLCCDCCCWCWECCCCCYSCCWRRNCSSWCSCCWRAARQQLLDAKDHAPLGRLSRRLIQLQAIQLSCRVHRSRSNSILISNWKPHAAFIPPAGAAWTRRSFRPSAPCLDLLRLAVSKHKRRQVQEFPACLPACRAPDIATHFAKNATLPPRTLSLQQTSHGWPGRASLCPRLVPVLVGSGWACARQVQHHVLQAAPRH